MCYSKAWHAFTCRSYPMSYANFSSGGLSLGFQYFYSLEFSSGSTNQLAGGFLKSGKEFRISGRSCHLGSVVFGYF